MRKALFNICASNFYPQKVKQWFLQFKMYFIKTLFFSPGLRRKKEVVSLSLSLPRLK